MGTPGRARGPPATPAPRPVKLLLALPLLALLAFCAFGFLATFEPLPNPLPWRLGYALVGTLAAAGLARLALSGRAGSA